MLEFASLRQLGSTLVLIPLSGSAAMFFVPRCPAWQIVVVVNLLFLWIAVMFTIC